MNLFHRAALKDPSFCKIKNREVNFNIELSFYIKYLYILILEFSE